MFLPMISLLILFLPLSTTAPLSGWVQSPGYPRGYPNEAKATWKRCAPDGHTLSLTLTHLDLEDSEDCQNDILEISSDEGTLVSLCGQKSYKELQSSVNPLLQSSVSGCLMLSFTSDFSNPKRHTGYRAFYTVQDVDECANPDNSCTQFCSNYIGGYRCFCRLGYFLGEDQHTCTVNCSKDLSGSQTGTVTSPGYPNAYAEHAHCSYTLAVDQILQLVLEFAGEFDIEKDEKGQCTDTLMIKTPSKEFGPFCGNATPPSPLLTESHQAKILFNSDGTGFNTGFKLTYRTTGKTCPGVVTPHSSLNPQKPEYLKGDQVIVRCDLGYVIDTIKLGNGILNDKEYKSVCQPTGSWSSVFPCGLVDCGPPDIPDDGPLQLLGEIPGTQYQDVVQFKCESTYYTLEPNESYFCSAEGYWTSKSGNTTLPRCEAVCGKAEDGIHSVSRILGGAIAQLGQIPWQLLLKKDGALKGGASLINDRWALTAAHVVDGLEHLPIDIYGGLVDQRQLNQLKNNKMKKDVMKNFPNLAVLDSEMILIHPGYDKSKTKDSRLSFDNDIALIKFKTRAKLSQALRPVCLPQKKEGVVMEGQVGTVSGWGKTEKREESIMLRHVNIIGYSDSKCSDVPLNRNSKMIYTKNMFCAGNNMKDSCKGDSGGPFVLPYIGKSIEKRPYRLHGLVSWGPECGEKGYYTKVENYLDWIKETMEKEENTNESEE